ncbi:MAG: hypothetical protein VX970_06885, partial [Planctomycetota bacterium]|nr:hypothetical protein [Planctomycetota bacterium]
PANIVTVSNCSTVCLVLVVVVTPVVAMQLRAAAATPDVTLHQLVAMRSQPADVRSPADVRRSRAARAAAVVASLTSFTAVAIVAAARR